MYLGNYDCVEIDDEAVASISFKDYITKVTAKLLLSQVTKILPFPSPFGVLKGMQGLGLHLPPEYIAAVLTILLTAAAKLWKRC